MLILTEELWAGTEAAYAWLLEREARALADREGMQAFILNLREQEPSKPYTVRDGVAIYRIAGPLTNLDPDEAEWWGVASYQGIQRDLLLAEADPEVAHILLDLDTPGGAVAGLSDTVEVIKGLSKPTTAYSSGSAYSGGIWLATSASEGFHISSMAGVGSIGVILTHVERSKMLEDIGIKATVLRAGEYKALASSVEPLSDKARAQLQARIDATYKHFVSHVAEARGVSYAVADSTMAQGREFIGQEARDVNLVDSVTSLNDLLAKVAQNIDIDNQLPKNKAASTQGRMTMSIEHIEQAAEAATEQQPSQAAEEATSHDSQAQVAAATEPATETSGASQNAAPEIVNDNAVVQALKEEMTKTVRLEAEVARLTGACDALKASNDLMKGIVLASVKQMSVALGQSASVAETASVDQLLEMHASLGATFSQKFPTGGVASVVPENPAEEGAKKAHVPQHRSRVAATKLHR